MMGAAPDRRPTRWDPASTFGGAVSNGDRTFSFVGGGAYQSVRGTPIRFGRYYFEVSFTAVGSFSGVGFTLNDFGGVAGGDTGAVGWRQNGGVFYESANVAAYSAFASGDVIGIAIDNWTGKIWFSKNGTWQSGDPGAGSGGLSIDPDRYYPQASVTSADSVTIPSAFTYPTPAGFTGV